VKTRWLGIIIMSTIVYRHVNPWVVVSECQLYNNLTGSVGFVKNRHHPYLMKTLFKKLYGWKRMSLYVAPIITPN